MSLIYAGGVKATAIASITAEIESCINTRADGTKWLDNQALVVWARAQFAQMLTDAEATAADFVAGQDPTPAALTLANVINPAHWQARSDWPVNTVVLTAAAKVDAVRAQQGVLKAASEAVTNYYADTRDKISLAIVDYLEGNIVADIDPGVERLIHDRAYIACYVSDRSEVSKPSPASVIVQLDQNDTATVTVAAPPSDRDITHFWLFRATAGNLTAAYLYVPCPTDDEGWPIGTLTIVDDVPDSELQEACPALTWDEPPADLRGITAGSNGAIAGFTGNTFCPSVNFRPYAFPVGLRRTTPDPIVGMGHFGDTWVVLTRGKPYYATAADTAILDFRATGSNDACTSADSIVSMESGVLFASPRGVCLAEAGGVRCLTDESGFNVFSREEWEGLDPTSIKGAFVQNSYLFAWTSGSDSGCYLLNLQTGRLCTVDLDASAFYYDRNSDTLYAASGPALNAVFQSSTLRTARWRGKMMEMDGSSQFSFVRVKDGANKEFDAPVTVRIFDGDAEHDTKRITDVTARRVASGRIGDLVLEVEAATRVTRVTLASSAEGLK